MLENFHDYTLLLKDELQKRKEKNRSYSLRAFARDLGIGATSLSDLFNGKRKLSPKNVTKVMDKLLKLAFKDTTLVI